MPDSHVMTVLGPISPSDLGMTLPHEHLLIDFAGPSYTLPGTAPERRLARQPVTFENLWWVRQYWGLSKDNLQLLDQDLAISEVHRFQLAGGATIVDATSQGLGRDAKGLVRIARSTGVHIVMGSGFYRAGWHPAQLGHAAEDEIRDEIVRDITDGVGDTEIRSGLIGEIGLSWPIHPTEMKVLRAAIRAQAQTRAPILIHPGRNSTEPRGSAAVEALMSLLTLVEDLGGDVAKTAIAHVERRLYQIEDVLSVARRGSFLAFDLFGEQTSFDPLAPPFPFPSDAQRLATIRALATEGRLSQVLVSHDICQKHRLTAFGGHGLDHIPRVVIPQMQALGFAEAEIQALLFENPMRLLMIRDDTGGREGGNGAGA